MSGDGHTNETRELNLDLPREGSCGYTLIDLDGEECPCDRAGVSWRWYQGHEHEDALDRACIIHENPGGIRMAALVAEVRRLREREAQLLETCESAARDIRFLLDPTTRNTVRSGPHE